MRSMMQATELQAKEAKEAEQQQEEEVDLEEKVDAAIEKAQKAQFIKRMVRSDEADQAAADGMREFAEDFQDLKPLYKATFANFDADNNEGVDRAEFDSFLVAYAAR